MLEAVPRDEFIVREASDHRFDFVPWNPEREATFRELVSLRRRKVAGLASSQPDDRHEARYDEPQDDRDEHDSRETTPRRARLPGVSTCALLRR